LPYSNETPINSVAVAVPPRTRYFSAASALCGRRRREAPAHNRKRHQLDSQEKREEAVGGQQQAYAVQRGQQQDRKCALPEFFARDEQHQNREREHDRLAEQRIRTHGELLRERRR
jgi:hypothetical protein